MNKALTTVCGLIVVPTVIIGVILAFLKGKGAWASTGWAYKDEKGPVVPSGIGGWQKVDFSCRVINEEEMTSTRDITLWLQRCVAQEYGGCSAPQALLTRPITLDPGEIYDFITGEGEEILIAYGESVEVWLEDNEGGESRHIKANLSGSPP